ncbi:hypothetical protein C3L23_08140 [Nautilia sp. PV-1]|nr:hypothetical protein C3L23_08140 [Nautilia sp. PV-1]
MQSKNNNLLLKLFLVLNISVIFLLASSTVFIQKIILKGDVSKQDLILAKPLLSKYENRKLTLKQIEELKEKLNKLFKKNGEVFTKVLLPPQKIKNHVLVIEIIKAKIGSISVYGNKYYSKKFIKSNLNMKKGDYLDYKTFMKSLLLLNENQDLQVKAYLKKGKKFGETKVNLDVNDSRPFHGSVSYDNLGSSSTSKDRISADILYGNLFSDGDLVNFHTTLGLNNWSTKLYKTTYTTKPFGRYHTRINMTYLYANYVVTGTFAVLDIKGDTKIATLGITQPMLYTVVDKVNMMLNFNKKESKSYLLGSVSSKDDIKILTLSASLKHSKIFSEINAVLSVSRGWDGDDAVGSRFEEDRNFFKYNLNSSYNFYLNLKNSFLFVLNMQYSNYRLPLSEMFSIGGMNSVRGYNPSVKLGDYGYSTSIEWFYHPEIKNKYFKNGVQIGFFIDNAGAYVNDPIPGEEKSLVLTGGGGEIIISIKKRYSCRIGVGYPIHSSYDVNSDNKSVYMIFNAKLW